MVAAPNLYLALGLIAVTNEQLMLYVRTLEIDSKRT
jgi:hypothetical protein